MSLLTPILTGKASLIARWLFYGAITLVVFLILWSAFFKKTESQHTVQTADRIINNQAGAHISIGFGGCATFQMTKPKEIK